MKKLWIAIMALATTSLTATAQRFTDKLGRGIVVVQTGATTGSTTNMVTWRRLGEEYWFVTYNLYKDGTLIAKNLTTTCYADNSNGLPTSQYQVAPVVRGVEQERSAAVSAWSQYVYKLGNNRCATGYLDIALAPVYDRDGNEVTSHYEPNDAELADVDGDGELEIIIKRLNTVDAKGYDSGLDDAKGNDRFIIYPKTSKEFVVFDAYDVDWQTGAATMLWRIDCGPNMVSHMMTETNIIAYDWDEDGRAEVVMRGADNMIVYGPDGKTQLYTIGDMTKNTRDTWYTTNEKGSPTGSMAYTHTGAEYLIYMNGETGALYQLTDYPLKRLETGETNLKTAWGDDYGHRSSKYFMGAPFLDGRKASLFLGRGIYTRHKMMAMDLDRSSHQWSERWRWNCNIPSSPWYGNGYHNFIVADVDEDGRDEIVYGSMVIDDNGKGLSTTGYGHGDSQHVSDFDPYRRGLEFFGCLEESRGKYGCNYRNATTSEIYYKHDGTEDDGRCLMANFSNEYPGCVGRSMQSGMINTVSDQLIDEYGGDSFINWGDLNFRIYWDGDLCSEILNSPGTAREAKIEKPGTGRLFTSSGCNMNNDSKNNPCFQGDVIGDWREEIIVRHGTDIRVYTSGMFTEHSLPTLWHDHQYRQAMVWQMMAYNQPPHLSYFLGEMEGITEAPPTLTNRDRVELADGSTIGTEYDRQHLLLATQGDMTVNVADGAAPAILTVNTPAWVQGHDSNGNITTTVYKHTLTGGRLSGEMLLVKQGNGILELPAGVHTYSGETQVWAGTLKFDGTLEHSPLWLNRFAVLDSDGGIFGSDITMDYDARLLPGGESHIGSITTTVLTMNFGARLVIDLDCSTQTADQVNAQQLVINTKDWQHGPQYLTPVIEFKVQQTPIPEGIYYIGTIGTIRGNLSDIRIEGLDGVEKYQLMLIGNKLCLVIGDDISAVTALKTDTKQPTEYYRIDGMRTDARQNGLYIVRQSDGTFRKVIR
ncbi:MAG: rhamnogalacturonan lyase [Prevotella sp.]|nr:rhamnogalacturonan lyase [Prevotella sp.]